MPENTDRAIRNTTDRADRSGLDAGQDQDQALAMIPGNPFTRENAASMARKAAIARVANAKRLADAANALDIIREDQRTRLAKAEAAADKSPERVRKVLERATASVDGLFQRLAEEIGADDIDAGKVQKLTEAVARMSELERVLSMRPAPAPLRSKPSKSRSDSATPLDPVAIAGEEPVQ